MRLTTPNVAGQSIRVKRYDSFKGVDYSVSETQIADSRSPEAVNLIPNAGGQPEKRPGWRRLVQITGGDKINGLFWFQDSGDNSCFLVHAESKLYKWLGGEDTPTVLRSDVNNAKSSALQADEMLIILTGQEILCFDGDAVYAAKDKAYVPTTSIARNDTSYLFPPTGTPGGTPYQPVNMLTNRRKNSFYVNNREGSLQFDVDIDDGAYITDFTFNGQVINDNQKVFFKDELGNKWDHLNYNHFLVRNTIWFSQEAEFPEGEGETGPDNMVVEFPHTNTEYESRIAKCDSLSHFNSRVWYTGNPDFINTDWHSELNEPLYVPDIAYTEVGAPSSRIMGYHLFGDAQVIVKEGKTDDAAIFLRTAELTNDGTIFPIKQGTGGLGACAAKSLATLVGDPLYLSKDGVNAIASETITAERVLQLRSTRVNARLTREANLQNAVACVWNGYYIICINNHAYVADSRQKEYTRNETGTFEYEWYFWDNIPATCLVEVEGSLYFGTADGKLCRFNTDMLSSEGIELMPEAYSDMPDGANGDKVAIRALWATKMDDDGDFMVLKNLQRKGSGVFTKVGKRTNIKVLARTDEDVSGITVSSVKRGVFDFNDIDFSNFTFRTTPDGIVPFGRKVKKYRAIQIVCLNEEVGQPFGIYAIERRFVGGYFTK